MNGKAVKPQSCHIYGKIVAEAIAPADGEAITGAYGARVRHIRSHSVA
jgi:hypothetical protein